MPTIKTLHAGSAMDIAGAAAVAAGVAAAVPASEPVTLTTLSAPYGIEELTAVSIDPKGVFVVVVWLTRLSPPTGPVNEDDEVGLGVVGETVCID